MLKVEANSKIENKIVAKVVNAGKEYKAGDTMITALKAIGAGNKYISKLILTQAMLFTIVGFVVGLVLLEGFKIGVAKSGLIFSFSPLVLIGMFTTIGLISLSGASFVLSRIRSVEPAAVFR